MASFSISSLTVEYDPAEDILYVLCTETAQEAIAEEVQGDVFVRFDPVSRQIVSIEILHFRHRLIQHFGPELQYTGSSLPEMVIPLITESKDRLP